MQSLKTSQWRTLRAYLLTALAIALSIPLRLVLDPVLGNTMPFVTVFPIVVVAAWCGGVGPALMATALGSAGVAFFVLEPRNSFAIASPEYRVGIVVNAIVCVACIAIFASLRRARLLAEWQAHEARRRGQQLEHEAAERAAIEASLRDSEQQFRALFELSAVGQAQADPTTMRFTRVNRRFCEITGYPENELIGKTFVEITHPDDRPNTVAGCQRLLRGETTEFGSQKRYLRKDGQPIWAQVNVALIERSEHQPARFAAIIQDVTVSKVLELSLKESEERFRGIFSQAAVGVGQTDLDRVVIDVNPGLCRMLGYMREELLGRHVTELTHPDEQEWAATTMQPLIEGKVESVSMDRRFRHKDGHYVPTHATASLIRDQNGVPQAVVAVVQDITERKQAEHALREADRRKDEFLATLAHELRNPLAPICNSLHILRLAGADAAAHEPLVEMMERQVSHMVRLVDDLLEVSRITRGKIELRKERVELAAVIRSAVEASLPMIDAGNHQLALSLPSEPISLEADPVRLAQVFANLLNNAAKYTDRGGQICLSARVLNGESRPSTEVEVSVRDTGMGIEKEKLPRVFDMFTQVGRSRRQAQPGLGIGLALVRNLVELHGGTVEARSEGLGKGSEFVVRLPTVSIQQPAKPTAIRPQRGNASVPSRRVLVVDDNRDAVESLAVLLRRMGLNVSVAYGGEEALEVLTSFDPNIVFLDIGMPVMDGYEVVRRIREQPGGRNRLVVALTGWGQEEDRRKSREAGFDYHLTKPVDLGQLQELLTPAEFSVERLAVSRSSNE